MSYGPAEVPETVTLWAPSPKLSGSVDTQPSVPCDAGGAVQVDLKSFAVTPVVSASTVLVVGLPVAIVPVSVTGSSGGAGGSGSTPVAVLEKTCSSALCTSAFVLPSGASVQNRMYCARTGSASLKVL